MPKFSYLGRPPLVVMSGLCYFRSIKLPSHGECEITSVNYASVQRGQLTNAIEAFLWRSTHFRFVSWADSCRGVRTSLELRAAANGLYTLTMKTGMAYTISFGHLGKSRD